VQAFHAVPAFERWESVVNAAKSVDVDFVPLIYPSAAVSRKMSADPMRWHAWEFSVRPFTVLNGTEIAKQTDRLLHAPCTCYDVFHGNADAFNPIARASAKRMRAFRQASLDRLPPATHLLTASWASRLTTSPPVLLWAVRQHALRNIENDHELERTFASDTLISSRLERVILERLSLAAQMRLIGEAAGLMGVHGQAMAWVFFLPAHARRTAAIEIFPAGLVNNIYRELSLSLGVRYEALNAPTAAGCSANGKLGCNVTVRISAVHNAVRRAVEWIT
jgi:hypothetical protein